MRLPRPYKFGLAMTEKDGFLSFAGMTETEVKMKKSVPEMT